MGMKYNLSVIEILNLFGYTSNKLEITSVLSLVNEIKLPAILSDFLKLAKDNPLFSTADVWTTCNPFFFYKEIEERIEEDKEYWEENPEDCDDDEYYQFSQIPKEQWYEFVKDYLQIGSDYAAGVVKFGICITDFGDDNPPVYMQHEANELTSWELINNKLSDYLMMVTGDVLSCVEYQTAQRVLKELGWNYQKYSDSDEVEQILSAKAINLSMEGKYNSLYGSNAEQYICYDDEQNIFYIVRNDKGKYELCTISKSFLEQQ